MLHIAICDDDLEQIDSLKQLISNYHSEHRHFDIRITAFTTGTALLEYIRVNGPFDIYIMDIIMPDINGIDLGHKIRKSDQSGAIIYLTVSSDYAIDSYLVKASAYLVKPICHKSMLATLHELVQNWTRENQNYTTIKTRNGIQRVSLRNIVYGELVGHCIQYHLADGTVLEGMSLRTSFRKAVEYLFESERFVLCATSFFVNLSFVEKIEASGLRLTNGASIPISRTLRTEIINRWMDYNLKGGK